MKVTAEQRHAWRTKTANSPFNQWLDLRVRDELGRLDLERLYQVALEYGIDGRARYAHLNPGQQRMTIGNLLRSVVPFSDYRPGEPVRGGPDAVADAPSVTEPPPLVRQASVRELLALHGHVLEELRCRRVVRTSNNPGGDYAELLFARAFGWELAANSAGGFDALCREGVRYQIKSRRITVHNGSRQLSALRKLPERHFDVLAGVIFSTDYSVLRAALIPHALIESRARYSNHVKAWLFNLDDVVWNLPGVTDVTEMLRLAAEKD